MSQPHIWIWECSIHGEFPAVDLDNTDCPGCGEWSEYPRPIGVWSCEEALQVISANRQVKVEWYDAGEGWSGDYTGEPDDEHLLRFDVYVWADNEWQDPGDASYCTQMPADTPSDVLMQALRDVMRAFENSWSGLPANREPHDYLNMGGGYRRSLEDMSWIGPKNYKEKIE